MIKRKTDINDLLDNNSETDSWRSVGVFEDEFLDIDENLLDHSMLTGANEQ